MGADRATFAGDQATWTATPGAVAGDCRSAALSVANRLALAIAAARFPEALDGAALLLRLAGCGPVGDDQFPAASTSARAGWARRQPLGRGDRQPIGQDDGKRRPARV